MKNFFLKLKNKIFSDKTTLIVWGEPAVGQYWVFKPEKEKTPTITTL